VLILLKTEYNTTAEMSMSMDNFKVAKTA